MGNINLEIQSGMSAAELTSLLNPRATAKKESVNALIRFLQGLVGGNYNLGASLQMLVGADYATGAVTVSAGGSANDETINIAGTTFTAKTSGATGNQFDIDSDEDVQAANMATAINASSDVNKIVSAVANAGVVTLTALLPGEVGNALQLENVDLANVAVTAFSGGDDGTQYDFDLS